MVVKINKPSMALDFQKKVSLFLKDRKNANIIVDLINLLKNDGPETVACIQALDQLFTQVFARGDFDIDSQLLVSNPKAHGIEEQYKKWLCELYESTFNRLIELLDTNDKDVQTQALQTLFNFLASETRKPLSSTNAFPGARLQKIINKVLWPQNQRNGLLIAYAPFLSYQDIFFYSWKCLKETLPGGDDSDDFTFSILELVDKMTPPKSEEAAQLLCYDNSKLFKYKEDMVKKWVQKVWLALTNRRLSPANHRKLLLLLLEKYLSRIHKPTLLTDFLTGSLAMGGAAGLLALQGMSVLVTKHNLECPNIFGKLYNMFQPEILHTRYKARLFYLADNFLRSTYVSEQLVAAFAKRLSRLSLVAQAPDLVLLMQFVGNLLIRHPALLTMVHQSNVQSVDADPYDMDEPEPLKSKAMESSLWELALLKNHVQPKVAAAAKFLDANLPAIEWNFQEHLDSSYSKLFESEVKKNVKVEPALTFVRPVSIAQLRDDRLYKMWSLI